MKGHTLNQSGLNDIDINWMLNWLRKVKQVSKMYFMQEMVEIFITEKDLGHFWLGYIRMLGHLQLGAHWSNFERL